MANRIQARLPFVKGQYGKNWRRLRESTGKTVRQFADKIHYSYSKISKIENETEYPTIEQINIYQDLFNVSFDYLIGFTNTTDIEKNKITRYTGLSEEAIDKLHNIMNEVNYNSCDYEQLLSDKKPKTSWKTELYNKLICNSLFDKLLNELNSFHKATLLLSNRAAEIETIDEILDGYIRGLIIKANLSEMAVRNSINDIIAEFDERNTNEFRNIWIKLQSELDNKCGIAEKADNTDIKTAKEHLAGKFSHHEYSSPTASNTLEMLMRVDLDDE